jgi:hypothetical protein
MCGRMDVSVTMLSLLRGLVLPDRDKVSDIDTDHEKHAELTRLLRNYRVKLRKTQGIEDANDVLPLRSLIHISFIYEVIRVFHRESTRILPQQLQALQPLSYSVRPVTNVFQRIKAIDNAEKEGGKKKGTRRLIERSLRREKKNGRIICRVGIDAPVHVVLVSNDMPSICTCSSSRRRKRKVWEGP